MKRIVKLVIFLTLFGGVAVKAQTLESVKSPSDKKKIELRPNSLDYGPVKRDNLNQRIDRKHDKQKFIKKRPAIKRQLVKPGIKKEIKNEPRPQRRPRAIQRRSLMR